MSESDFSALAMVDGAAGQISADGHADDRRRLELSRGAPAHHGELVADLHHGRPDVVEELNFRDGLQAARGHADGAADDAGFRQRRIENAGAAEAALQAGGSLEDAA